MRHFKLPNNSIATCKHPLRGFEPTIVCFSGGRDDRDFQFQFSALITKLPRLFSLQTHPPITKAPTFFHILFAQNMFQPLSGLFSGAFIKH
jgi:hypothetical protein